MKDNLLLLHLRLVINIIWLGFGHMIITHRLTVDFGWKNGVAAKDWPNVAKKGQIDFMEMELRMLEDVVRSVHDEMIYLREREEDMHGINRATNSKTAWLGFYSMFVCLSVAGLQL
ncbi:hypothetical protein MKW98_001987 [Papaver atlanticum]|uniref:GOLD domain-containing protein n=1 Tax=Papaver atlanticum TaxID=357466 RepID=A0AAD4SPJ2_9MAGN|nr:hypothetical protein MKW98_001987 [Papaver atlanticum]